MILVAVIFMASISPQLFFSLLSTFVCYGWTSFPELLSEEEFKVPVFLVTFLQLCSLILDILNQQNVLCLDDLGIESRKGKKRITFNQNRLAIK